MSRFPSDQHLASWAAMCPGNRQSAGKRKSNHNNHGNRWLRSALVQAAPWKAFGPIDHRSARLPPEMLQLPDTLVVDGATLQARCMTPIRSQLNLAPLLGPSPTAVGRSAIVCVNIQASSPTIATIGIDADHRFQAWLDGTPLAGPAAGPFIICAGD